MRVATKKKWVYPEPETGSPDPETPDPETPLYNLTESLETEIQSLIKYDQSIRDRSISPETLDSLSETILSLQVILDNLQRLETRETGDSDLC